MTHMQPEQHAILHSQHIRIEPMIPLATYLSEAYLAGYRRAMEDRYVSPHDGVAQKPGGPTDGPTTPGRHILVGGPLPPRDDPFTPLGIPEESPEDPSSWRAVIHAHGPGACQRPAFYVIRKISRYRNGKVKWLRYLNGQMPKAGDPQVCGTCHAEIIFWSARFLDWQAHFMTEEEEQQDQLREERKDPRSPISLQEQHNELQRALGPLAEQLPQIPNFGPTIVNGRIVVDPTGVPTRGAIEQALTPPTYQPIVEGEVPYQPYPQGFDPANPSGSSSAAQSPWDNIGEMIRKADAVRPADSIPNDMGLPPDHPDMQEPLPDLPQEAVLDLLASRAVQSQEVVLSAGTLTTVPAAAEESSGEQAGQPLQEDSAEVASQED